MEKFYMCIDLKSFYASVECRERGLNPLTTNLVVADESRTEKTICLAVTPALKKYGIPGRVRLFEVNQKVRQINYERKRLAHRNRFIRKSYNSDELETNKNLELTFLIAKPRMGLYMKYSTDIYNIYLKYISDEDMFVYSVDEVFFEITKYLNYYKMTPKELATKIIKEVFETTGITATCGIGTNLYLAKIAMDVWAKKVMPDKNGVRIAELDEFSYRKFLWNHRPIKDFWRVGSGYSKKLEENGIFTMGDIARCSIGKSSDFYNEELLYKLFGINAELLIDHSWGWEPCTIKDIKNFKPSSNSISLGQVLHCPYNYEQTKLIIREMADSLVLDLVAKGLVTKQIVLTIGYDVSNKNYKGEKTLDKYSREVPKHAHGTINLEKNTSSTKIIMNAAQILYERIINKDLLIRRIYIVANNVISSNQTSEEKDFEQLDFFTNYEEKKKQEEIEKNNDIEERNLQKTILSIKKKYGKNAILRGMNFIEGGTSIDRNKQVGGHRE